MSRSNNVVGRTWGVWLVGLVAFSAMQCVDELHRVLHEIPAADVGLLGKSQQLLLHSEQHQENGVLAGTMAATAATLKREESPSAANNTESWLDDDDDQPSILSYTQAALKYQGHTILLSWDKSGRLDLERMNQTLENAAYPQWWHSSLVEHLQRVPPSETGTVALLLHSDVIEGVDWDIYCPIPFLAYSAPLDKTSENNVYLIPSPYELLGWNDGPIQEARKPNIPLQQRQNKMIWRGEIHGWPRPEQSRVKLAEMGKDPANTDWLNATETSYKGSNFVTAQEHALYRYQIDIGGVSGTTWGALRWKMCSGSLVFKVESNARDWWHEFLRPWVHYVPVKEDLSDLHEKYLWAQSNAQGAQIIAQAGEDICLETSRPNFVRDYLRKVMQSLPPASVRYKKEASLLLEGLLESNKLVAA